MALFLAEFFLAELFPVYLPCGFRAHRALAAFADIADRFRRLSLAAAHGRP